jgi:ankyrin repeat protein
VQSWEALTVLQLLDAARDGNEARVCQLLSTQSAHSLINYQDAQGASPLYIAAQKGLAAVTEQLIAAHCNVDLQDEIGYTPLHIAAGYRQECVAKQLLAAR